jgi:hypothetical protein
MSLVDGYMMEASDAPSVFHTEMEEADSSEMLLLFNQETRRHIPAAVKS